MLDQKYLTFKNPNNNNLFIYFSFLLTHNITVGLLIKQLAATPILPPSHLLKSKTKSLMIIYSFQKVSFLFTKLSYITFHPLWQISKQSFSNKVKLSRHQPYVFSETTPNNNVKYGLPFKTGQGKYKLPESHPNTILLLW